MLPSGCGDDVLATMAPAWVDEPLPADTGPLSPDRLTVPTEAVLAGPAGRPAFGTVVVVVVLVLLACRTERPVGGEHALGHRARADAQARRRPTALPRHSS